MNIKDGIPFPTRQASGGRSCRMFNVAAVFLLLSFLLFLCQIINFGVFKTSARGSDHLPVSIRATSQADYSGDIHAPSIPPISENILRQIILDMPATVSPEDRLATLEFSLSQPVPTMTLDPLFPATFTPTRTLEPTRTRPPSRTPIPTLSKTRTPTPTSTPTKFLTSSRTATSTRTSTRTPTATQTETPTASATSPSRPTAESTSTRTPAPTATSFEPIDTPTPTQQIPPTATSLSTSTPTPTSTDMVITDPSPQTETPMCALTSSGISISENELQLPLTNNGDAPVTIVSIRIVWLDEPDSQTLTEVRFGDVTIVNANDPQPPSDYPSERQWSASQDNLTLAVSGSNLLVFLFSEGLQPDGYSIDITFDNGCVLGESH